MKYIYIILIILTGVFSCNPECPKIEISTSVYQYIGFFKTLGKGSDIDLLVMVNKDSTSLSYEAFRIYASTILLDNNQIPSKIETYNQMKIAYFVNILKEKNEINNMRKLLSENKYYNNDSSFISSNYPEWVLLIRKKDKCTILVKDTEYKDLNQIISEVGWEY